MNIDKNSVNPVLESAKYILKNNAHVRVSQEGTAKAAKLLLDKMDQQKYSPATWKTQPLHPPPDLLKSKSKECLDWIFLVSALNFSFWSELEGRSTRYGVEWKKSWNDTSEERVKWEGYWSLPAALNKALENGTPVTDPSFYASEEACPNALIEQVFAPAQGCAESVPLLEERIRIMREVGKVLLEDVPGQSYMGLLRDVASSKHSGNRTLLLLNKIVEYFPCFRDEASHNGTSVVFWKRAQILIAETWAAFYPEDPSEPHPLIPDGVDILTMFADYRVPQILHHIGMLEYSNELIQKLNGRENLKYGSPLEMSIRAGSIVTVDEVKNRILELGSQRLEAGGLIREVQINCVLIDFFLWDLAKLMESGNALAEKALEVLPCHRTRSIYY